MRQALILLFIAASLQAGISSCCCKKKTPPEPDYAAQGYTKATVIRYELDGCMWMLELEDKSKKEPQNLTEEFRQDGMKVWVKYSKVKGGASICMAGEMVKIDAIAARK